VSFSKVKQAISSFNADKSPVEDGIFPDPLQDSPGIIGLAVEIFRAYIAVRCHYPGG
jgi:hypothetical protein